MQTCPSASLPPLSHPAQNLIPDNLGIPCARCRNLDEKFSVYARVSVIDGWISVVIFPEQSLAHLLFGLLLAVVQHAVQVEAEAAGNKRW